MDIKKRFGARIKELRKKEGLIQKEFAKECRLERTYIVDIESGKRNLSLENIEKIAKALKISLSELFKEL